ncbi:ABC transporter substrate-binding protein [Rhizobium laguerreae]|uniref:ABC transporter substrate-binding protein n=1 Tax=Rhizobium laguerreae TaxID=1076926 RepID=A0AB35FLQ7_9HYPH|nr:ABC transporter substrate-binding protein [Rhizobium laguerreae]MBY3066588.1 ABC transporter substrate-binding protein [Rhizobium laguerreae]MBY3079865.1 ABC transporter substrate-binding protein [Rhizobium laguerreae]MBY3113470.1 ABC transporter substrate-binding protein [Rhizobium laguerreae]NKM12530.1 ABC transporter substrate-binding protein [Rhizobium laguerreae]
MAYFSRRQFLAGAAASLSVPAYSRAAESVRVATLDWALLETLLAIGANVVAATELRQFREVAITPDVPATTADLGLRGTPNFEVLRFARPDLIFNSNFYAWADERMRGVAPVESHAIYRPGESPFALAEQATLAIGERLQLATARQLTEELAARLDRYRALLAAGDGRPVIPINLGDARHFRVFGSDSMFGEVLKRVGLTNAWQARTSYSAAAPVGIEILASMPDAWIVMIPPHPAYALATLATSSFWNALPAVREKRVLMLGSINPYGALPAAGRFADLLAEGLTHAWNG